jgi:hypothetical protein
MATISIHYTMDDDDLWSDVMGSAWETCPWWFWLDYDGGDWDEPCTLWVAVANPDNDHWFEDGVLTATITIDDVVRALEELRDHPVVMECLRNQDFDAIYGDVVIQQAVLGEVIYG